MSQENPPDIPYDKNLELVPGRADEPMPGVRRVLCNNPSPFTFKGTVSYIVGRGKVAIIDPGPEDPVHSAALLDAVRGETVTHMFVTHTHRDHAPGVPAIKSATGAIVLAEGPHRAARALHVGDGPRLESSNDVDFKPDRALADGEVVRGDGWTLEAVTTPGHTANHMAFAFKENNVLFSGHGPAVNNAPRFVAAYILHRKAREASILNRLQNGESDIPTMVNAIYANLDPRLLKSAGMSVLAHLEDLVARGAVTTNGPASIAGRYRLA